MIILEGRNRMELYANMRDYLIMGKAENSTIVFYVCDKMEEIYYKHAFKSAADAIDWADANFKGLI